MLTPIILIQKMGMIIDAEKPIIIPMIATKEIPIELESPTKKGRFSFIESVITINCVLSPSSARKIKPKDIKKA